MTRHCRFENLAHVTLFGGLACEPLTAPFVPGTRTEPYSMHVGKEMVARNGSQASPLNLR